MARWVRGWDVNSDSDIDKIYRVSISDNGEWGCSCPVWKFRRQTCKHILAVQGEQNLDAGDIGTAIRLKSELIAKYKAQGKTDEWIMKTLS